MWPLAGCISSMLVRTPSLQLGVLQSLQGSFLLHLNLLFHLALSLSHTSGGSQGEGIRVCHYLLHGPSQA